MKTVPKIPRAKAAASALLFFTSFVFAQTAPSAPSVASPADTVQLGAFEVRATPDGRYLAAESVTGSRVAARTRDLPFPIQIVTSEFLSDFALNEVDSALAYTSGFAPGETLAGGNQGQFTRGFSGSYQLRDGFNRIGMLDRVNIDRIEVIKGPYASIYGRAQPGGIVNIVSKQPSAQSRQNLRATVGGYDHRRYELSSTGPLGTDKLLYRIDTAYLRAEGAQDFWYSRTEPITGKLQWTPTLRTRLTFEAEYVERWMNFGNMVPLLRPQGVTPNTAAAVNLATTRYAANLRTFSTQGPANYGDRRLTGFTLTGEHKLTDRVALRAAAYHSDRSFFRHAIIGGEWLNINPVTGAQNLGSVTGTADRQPQHNAALSTYDAFQVDTLARWKTGPLAHQLLVTFDWFKLDDTRFSVRLANNLVNNPAYNLTALDPRAPNYFASIYRQGHEADFSRRAQDVDNTTEAAGAFASYRATALEGRLIGSFGLRRDFVRNTLRSAALTDPRPPFVVSEFKPRSTTYNVGANLELAPGLTLFASHSTSFDPQAVNDGLGTAEIKNETGTGYEGGVKASLFGDALSFTATTFHIVRENVRIANPNSPANGGSDPNAPPFILNGQQTSQGVEFDGSWQPTPGLTTFAGVGYTDAVVDRGPATDVGRQIARVPRVTGGAGLRYRWLTGRLKGVGVTAGYRYVGSSFYDNTRPNLPTPSYDLVDIGAHYGWRRGRIGHRVQLNISNLLDKGCISNWRRAGDGRQALASYAVQF